MKKLSIYNGNVIHKYILDIVKFGKNNILLMSLKRTFDICMVEINWKLSGIDLTLVNHTKDKKNFIEILLPSLWTLCFRPIFIL